jgi:hypothetical protein
MRLGGLQVQSGCYGDENDLLGLPGIEYQFLSRLASNLSLYRLSNPGSYDKIYWPKLYPYGKRVQQRNNTTACGGYAGVRPLSLIAWTEGNEH